MSKNNANTENEQAARKAAEGGDKQDAGDYLNLKVKSQVLLYVFQFTIKLSFKQDSEEVFFKMKKSTQFKKPMDAYCKRQEVRFFAESIGYINIPQCRSTLKMCDFCSIERE